MPSYVPDGETVGFLPRPIFTLNFEREDEERNSELEIRDELLGYLLQTSQKGPGTCRGEMERERDGKV
jgi:hypothetical protein